MGLLTLWGVGKSRQEEIRLGRGAPRWTVGAKKREGSSDRRGLNPKPPAHLQAATVRIGPLPLQGKHVGLRGGGEGEGGGLDMENSSSERLGGRGEASLQA